MGYDEWVEVEYYSNGVLVKTDFLSSHKFYGNECTFNIPVGADSIKVKWRTEFDHSESEYSSCEDEPQGVGGTEGEDVCGIR